MEAAAVKRAEAGGATVPPVQDPDGCINLQERAKHDPDKAFAYVSGRDAAACRQTPGHMRLIHTLQQSDMYDPWLQHEWALSLLAHGAERKEEAVLHLHAAGKLFLIFSKPDPPVELLDMDQALASYKRARSHGQDARALIDKGNVCLEHALQLNSQSLSHCQLFIELMEGKAALATVVTGVHEQMAVLQQARKLLKEIMDRPECTSYKDLLPPLLVESMGKLR